MVGLKYKKICWLYECRIVEIQLIITLSDSTEEESTANFQIEYNLRKLSQEVLSMGEGRVKPYCAGDPVNLVDPDGRKLRITNGNKCLWAWLSHIYYKDT